MLFMFYADKLFILEALKRSQNGSWSAPQDSTPEELLEAVKALEAQRISTRGSILVERP